MAVPAARAGPPTCIADNGKPCLGSDVIPRKFWNNLDGGDPCFVMEGGYPPGQRVSKILDLAVPILDGRLDVGDLLGVVEGEVGAVLAHGHGLQLAHKTEGGKN